MKYLVLFLALTGCDQNNAYVYRLVCGDSYTSHYAAKITFNRNNAVFYDAHGKSKSVYSMPPGCVLEKKSISNEN